MARMHKLDLFAFAFSLFLLMDPVGNVPIYMSILAHSPPKRQYQIIVRELIIALFVILIFAFLGEKLLATLKISQDTVSVGGGVVLFLIAIRMIFPQENSTYSQKPQEEPFIVPLAIPFVAGPAVLASVMIFSHKAESFITLIQAIFIAWIGTFLVLISSPFLKKVLGKRGAAACERLMGLILILISIQMILVGMRNFLT